MVGEPRDEWAGDNPLYLIIQNAEGNTVIDLDQPGWVAANAALMREPGAWLLNHKSVLQTVAMILVFPGEQPYYTARHVGVAFGGAGELIAYGIGKKRLDGHVDRLWVLPNGVMCAGDDMEPILLSFIKAGGVMTEERMTTGSLGAKADDVAVVPIEDKDEDQSAPKDGPNEAESADKEVPVDMGGQPAQMM